MHIEDIIRHAREHASDNQAHAGSAHLCLSDAIKLLEEGKYGQARTRALRSLQYSLGVFHPIYKRCAE